MGIIIRNMNATTGISNIRIGGTSSSDSGSTGGGAGGSLIGSTTGYCDLERQIGYFGTIAASDFFTGNELASLLNVTQGTSMNTNTEWMKFTIDGKTLFVPKLPIRSHISWDHLYSKGLVYGTDDNGIAPTGTPTNQLRVVSKDGFDYKVRLLTGGSGDTHNGSSTHSTANCSEWNELMYRVAASNPNGVSDNFEVFSNAELGFTGSTGSYMWCQEQWSPSNTVSRVLRGSSSVDTLHRHTSSNTSVSRGWRLALELL